MTPSGVINDTIPCHIVRDLYKLSKLVFSTYDNHSAFEELEVNDHGTAGILH